MEILAIIPARGGSKGLPGKNIRDLAGKPLIAHTIAEAGKSRYLNRVLVSTDDPEIAGVSEVYGAEVPFLRPAALASDTSPSIDAILYTVQRLKESEGYSPDYVCLLQCTAPMKTARHIDEAIERLIATKMDGIVSVCEAEVHPCWTQVFKGDKLESFIKQEGLVLRRQDLPEVYRFNGAIWVVRTTSLLQEKSMIVKNETGYIMSVDDSVDIDTERDFRYAEMLIREREGK